VRPDGSITDVAVDTGAVTVHASRARTPSAVEKGIAAAEVQALSVAPGVLVYSGIRRSAGGRLVPTGVRLVDTRTWRDRLLIAHASGFAYADGTILAYQPFVDQLGRAIPRTGVHVYTAAGRLRLRTFSDEQVELVRVQGRYAYLAGPGGTSVLDLRSGALSVAVTDASLSFELLAGPGSLTAAGG
jgi:hypothetical protein